MTSPTDTRDGLAAGVAAYVMWGLFPVYFMYVAAVSPTEVLVHRIVWAVPFGAFIIALRKQWPEVREVLTHRGMLLTLVVSASLITINWLVYIWAVPQGRILESSLGYYISPLIYVLAGVVFFGERLNRRQSVAVGLAAIGVTIMTVSYGSLPWVALVLAFSFTGYGVVRKRIVIGAMPGLFVETLLLYPIAIGWLVWLIATGTATFWSGDVTMSVWLAIGGPLTVLPLLLFAIAARRLPLTTIGFIQFLAPTLQFCTGIYFGEPLSNTTLVCFGFIWSAVLVFSFDAVQAGRRRQPESTGESA